MRRSIQDDQEARLMMSCAGVLKPLEEAVNDSVPMCRFALWELNGDWHLGVRWTGQRKKEDNGYSVFISDDKAHLCNFAASLVQGEPKMFIKPPEL